MKVFTSWVFFQLCSWLVISFSGVSQSPPSSMIQLADASVSCIVLNDYALYDSTELGLAGSSNTIFTYSFWFQTPTLVDWVLLVPGLNYVIARFNDYPETGVYRRLMIYYDFLTSSYIMEAFYNESPVATTNVGSISAQSWVFFSQTIDYTKNTATNYFYYPSTATSVSANGVTTQTQSFPSGTSDIILNKERLYLGGATNAPNSCGIFQRIFVSATTASSDIPEMDVLRFGYTGIEYVALFQLNELQGQSAQSSIDSNYNFNFGSDSLNSDSNDPAWDLNNGGIMFVQPSSPTPATIKYISLSGSLLLMVDGTGYPLQFLQKGPLLLSYGNGNKLHVAIGSTNFTFTSISAIPGEVYNFYRLYCSNYQRPTIFCELWVNEQTQGVLVFPSTVSFVDSSSVPIMIPPSTCGDLCINGSLRQFLIARNQTTIYPTTVSVGSCLWDLPSNDGTCYKVNPSYILRLICPNQTFYDSVSSTCISCYPGCEQCTNGSLYACTACPAGFVLAGGTCACPTWASFDPTSNSCVINCISNCSTCGLSTNISNITTVICNQCDPGYYYLSSSNVCTQTCPSGYNANITTGTCIQINCSTDCYNCPSCVSCENNSYCNSCQSSLLLEDGVCVNSCVSHPVSLNGVCMSSCPKSYAAQNQEGNSSLCVPCDATCETCSNVSYNTCLTCNSGSYLLNGVCTSSCPIGYAAQIQEGNSSLCVPCDATCETCSNVSYNTCLTCNSASYLLKGVCMSSCPIDYAAQNQEGNSSLCVPCDATCKTCSNISYSTCLTCNSGSYLSNGTCLRCDASCSKCSNNASNCTSCSTEYPVSLNGVCMSSCPIGYAAQNQEGNSSLCVPCDATCETCSNVSYNTCLTCSLGRYLSNGTCLKCDAFCSNCSDNASNCTSCSTGYYYLLGGSPNCVSSCPASNYADNTSQTCLQCSEPMALTPTNNCVFCGGNCQVCSDSGLCSLCDPGLQLINGYCTIPGMQSSLWSQSGAIMSVTSLSVLQHATFQTVVTVFSQNVKTSSDFKRLWLLFAEDIASDYLSLSCKDIEEMYVSNVSDFPSSVVQIGNYGFQYLSYTQSNGFYLNFSELRAGVIYNFTICLGNQSEDNIWEVESVEFKTKENGYQIKKVSIITDNPLPQNEIVSFLCALSASLNVTNSTISTTTAESCTNSISATRRRNLDNKKTGEIYLQTKEPSRSGSALRSMAIANTAQGTQLDLLIYGNAQSEQLDQTTNLAVGLLTSATFSQSFIYTSLSGSSIKILHVNVGEKVFMAPPANENLDLSYEIRGNVLFFPNLTFTRTDGYLYIYLIPNTSSQSGLNDLPSSPTILNSINSNYLSNTSEAILSRIKFFDGEATAVRIDGIKTNITYNVELFATNEDVSPFAFRTPSTLFQVVTGLTLPAINRVASVLVFIIMESMALIFLVIAWYLLMSSADISQTCRNLRERCRTRRIKLYLADRPKEEVKQIGKERVKIVDKEKSPTPSLDCSFQLSEKEIYSSSPTTTKTPSISRDIKGISTGFSDPAIQISQTPVRTLSARTLNKKDGKISIDLSKAAEITNDKETPTFVRVDSQGNKTKAHFERRFLPS